MNRSPQQNVLPATAVKPGSSLICWVAVYATQLPLATVTVRLVTIVPD
jgi:hypothetical protein